MSPHPIPRLFETIGRSKEGAIFGCSAAIGTALEVDGRTLGPFVSMREQMLKDRSTWIRYEMDKLHDRVRKLRDLTPPEPDSDRKWWQWWRA